jgi:hypothetical protein
MGVIICKITSPTSATGCSTGSGIVSVKAIPYSSINVATMNATSASVTSFIDNTPVVGGNPTLKMKNLAIPLIAGASWTVLDFDTTANPTREADYDDFKAQATIKIGSLRFRGVYDTGLIRGLKQCCNWVTATLYADGTVMIDGLEFDVYNDKFLANGKNGGIKMKAHKSTSGDGQSELGSNTSFDIAGITNDIGYTTALPWASIV